MRSIINLSPRTHALNCGNYGIPVAILYYEKKKCLYRVHECKENEVKEASSEIDIDLHEIFVHDKGVKGNELLKAFPNYSKATIYRHAKLPFDENHPFDKRKLNKGRPRKLTVRDERNLVRQLRIYRETMGSFGASTLRTAADIIPNVSLWAIRRALRRHGYLYLQSRKKGLMTRRDADIALPAR